MFQSAKNSDVDRFHPEQPELQSVSLLHPRCHVVMDSTGILGDVHLSGIVVERTEILNGINQQVIHADDATFKHLLVVIVQELGYLQCNITRVLSVPAHIVMVVVEVHHLRKERMPLPDGHPQSRIHIAVGVVLRNTFLTLESHVHSVGQDVVHRTYHLHVRIEIDATIMVENPESCIVAHVGILLQPIGFCYIWCLIDVEVALVPFFNLVVWKELLP